MYLLIKATVVRMSRLNRSSERIRALSCGTFNLQLKFSPPLIKLGSFLLTPVNEAEAIGSKQHSDSQGS